MDQLDRPAVPVESSLRPGSVGADVAVETVLLSRRALRRRLEADLAVADAVPVSRRRRHASDLTAELPVVRLGDAAQDPGAGRHRAPGAAGRHRASGDSGVLPRLRATDELGRRSDFGTEVIRWDAATAPSWAVGVSTDA